MLNILYFALTLFTLLACCLTALACGVLMHSLRRMRYEERLEINEEHAEMSLMDSVRSGWR